MPKIVELCTASQDTREVHGRFLHAAFRAVFKKLDHFDLRSLANLAWALAVSGKRPSLLCDISNAAAHIRCSIIEAQSALRRELPNVSSESEAQSLIFSVLALAWALRFCSSLGKDLETELRHGLHRIAHFLEKLPSSCPSTSSSYQRSPISNKLDPELPSIVLQCAGLLVALKPPGWEVDTSVAEDSEALCLSSFLQEQESPLLFNLQHGFGFIHRLDVASSGLVLAAGTYQGLICLQWQKALCAIDRFSVREYIVMCAGLDFAVQQVVTAEVAIQGLRFQKNSRTLPYLVSNSFLKNLFGLLHLPTEGMSLVAIKIYTGRRHQIRAHTRFIGHPTACDAWYAPSAVYLSTKDLLGPAPLRSWVRTPRWVGELPAPPQDRNRKGHVGDQNDKIQLQNLEKEIIEI
eukprot:Skav225854  [mRNA]  locus=scaffold345:258177:261641:+ [translate_table: standard]